MTTDRNTNPDLATLELRAEFLLDLPWPATFAPKSEVRAWKSAHRAKLVAILADIAVCSNPSHLSLTVRHLNNQLSATK